MIADGDDVAVGIAGVMGGASTEISATTTDGAAGVAWWRPDGRGAHGSERLGLRSEASARFERGTDPEVVDLAARRFAELLAAEVAATSLAPGVVDRAAASCPTGRRCGSAPVG